MDVINEGDKIAQEVSFTNYCRLLEKLSAGTTTSSKRDILTRFVVFWAQQYTNLALGDAFVAAGRASFYPVLRLLLPQHDHNRPAYGLRANSLARLYIKLWGMASSGQAAKALLRMTDEGSQFASGRHKRTDFADLIYSTISERCPTANTLTIKLVNELLDRLASSASNNDRLTALTSIIQSATALEHKWIVRLIVRRESGCGMTAKSVLQCLHPSAPELWDVTQNLCILCQRLANLPIPGETKAVTDPSKRSPGLTDSFNGVTLFVPFRPMLCERANSPKDLCTAVVKLTLSTNSHLLLETKYDGERVQVHKSGANYRYWSRNSLEWTSSYGACATDHSSASYLTPHLHLTFASHVNDCIIDGEMMIFNTWTECIVPKTSGFDVKRSRGDRWKPIDWSRSDIELEDDEGACYVHPCLIAFDLLYLNGETLTQHSVIKRKHMLAEVFGQSPSANSIKLLSSLTDSTPEEAVIGPPAPLALLPGRVYLSGWCQSSVDDSVISRVFNHLIDSRQEGLVAKLISTDRQSTYQPGRRTAGGWWKLKPDYVAGLLEDLDCLVVGGYSTSQSRRMRHFLCAVRGPDIATSCVDKSIPPLPCFLSFCRVRTGLSIAQLKKLNDKLKTHWKPYDRKKPNSGVTEWLQVKSERPDFWISPQHSVTLQLHAAELVATSSYAAGLTLRFPRIVAIREDKSWTDCLSLDELQRLNAETVGKLALRRIDINLGYTEVNKKNEDSGIGVVGCGSPSSTSLSSSVTPESLSNSSNSKLSSIGTNHGKRSYPKHFTPAATSTPQKVQKWAQGSGSISGLDTLSPSPKNFLNGNEFCIMLSAERALEETSSLESRVVAAGGVAVKNPTARTFCLIADKLTVKAKNLVQFGKRSKRLAATDGYDIVHVSWLYGCLRSERLLPRRPMDMIVAKASTEAELTSEYDMYGDNYTESVDPLQLRILFDQMIDNRADQFTNVTSHEYYKCTYTLLDQAAVGGLVSTEFSDTKWISTWKPLHNCSILLLRPCFCCVKTRNPSLSGKQTSCSWNLDGISAHSVGRCLDRLRSTDLRRLGASSVDCLVEEETDCKSVIALLSEPSKKELSHIVVIGQIFYGSRLPQLLSGYQKTLHVVGEAWVTDCITEGRRCEETAYYLMVE